MKRRVGVHKGAAQVIAPGLALPGSTGNCAILRGNHQNIFSTLFWGCGCNACLLEQRNGASFFYHGHQGTEYMKIVAALTDPSQASSAQDLGADLIELRFDLMEDDPLTCVQKCRDACPLPIIGTIRSAQEGGMFFGDATAWLEKMCPVIPLVDYIDIEQRFASCVSQVRASGTTIIASHHTGIMLSLPHLFALERDLRAYGDIVKIIVTPHNKGDILELLEFTHAIKKPVCTGVMGAQFRYARAILPLFGSVLVYCHTGTRTAEGQYSVQEFVSLMKLLKNG